MSIFLLVFGLFMLGACAVVSSPVPGTWGKRVFLFIVGAALWVGAYVVVRSQEEILLDFLFSDWALSGKLANQVGASLVVFGFGWFFFIAKSLRVARVEIQWGDPRYNLNGPERQWVQGERKFRPWPSLLVWIPIVTLLTAVWIVPAHFGGYGIEPDVTPTAIPSNTPTPTWAPWPTSTSTATSEPTATSMPTNTPTHTPTNTPEPTATLTITSNPTTAVVPTHDPNKPALACNGTWLHEEPVQLGGFRILFELCDGGRYFVTHEIGSDWGLIPLGSTSFMTGNATYEFELINGELLVNGTPFADWLASQGGR